MSARETPQGQTGAVYDRRVGMFHVSQVQVDPDPAGGPCNPMQCRGFVRTWDVDAEGQTKGDFAPTGWARGTIVRRSQPAFVLTQLGPMYDPSAPNTWRPGL